MQDFSTQDQHWMQRALELAQHAAGKNEVPVGAVLVLNNQNIGEGFNQPIASHDPTAHAEIIALRQAAKQLQNYRLVATTLYVTLEPCVMCVGALLQARIARVVYAAEDPKAGAVHSKAKIAALTHNHQIICEKGLLAESSSQLLKDFFQMRRK